MSQKSRKPLQPPPLDEHGLCGVHNAAIYQCPYIFSLQAFTEVANCSIMHYNGARAGPNLDCGGGSSCLLLHATYIPLQLVLMLALFTSINWRQIHIHTQSIFTGGGGGSRLSGH